MLAFYAINVLHTQNELLMNQWWERQVPFDISMYMLEASVTLGVTLLRNKHNVYANEWRKELAMAIDVFESIRERDFGKIVAQALQVLKALQELCTETHVKMLPMASPVYATSPHSESCYGAELGYGSGAEHDNEIGASVVAGANNANFVEHEEAKFYPYPMDPYSTSIMPVQPPTTAVYDGTWMQNGVQNDFNPAVVMPGDGYATYPLWTSNEMMTAPNGSAEYNQYAP